MIDRVTRQKIEDTADIYEVVKDYVQLHKRGANYMGLCPFHNERTPSFSVNRRKNICYCFSCKKGGSPANFIKEKEGVSYWEALRILAKKYGIKIEEKELSDSERENLKKREALFLVNEWAMKKMHSDLTETEEGRNVGLQYFSHRGVTDEAIREFKLGYAMDEWQYLTETAEKAGWELEILDEAGLVSKSEKPGRAVRYYDRFRGRVVFPIFSRIGKVVGFGARDLKGDGAKYLNTAETEIYKKSYEAYGFYQAKSSIQKEDKCFIVEGYMDVIGMWQSGIRNVVAPLGTALTKEQIRLIKTLTQRVTLLFDGDEPGIKSALKSINLLLEEGMDTKVLLLPDGDDPDSFARKHTPEEFKRFVAENETEPLRFQAKVLLSGKENDPGSRVAAIREAVKSVSKIADGIQRDVYIQECSHLFGISVETVTGEVARLRNEEIKSATVRVQREAKEEETDAALPAIVHSPYLALEETLIGYLIKYGMLTLAQSTDEHGSVSYISVLEYIKEELESDNMEFSTPILHRLYDIICQRAMSFQDEWELQLPKLEEEIQEMRQQGFDEIAKKNLDMRGIQAEEKKLEETLSSILPERKELFARTYLERYLVNHEDDEIRTTATGFVVEQYQLSNLYVKTGNVERDEDRLLLIVPRAMIEWKTELINAKFKEAMHKLEETKPEDEEAIRLIQLEINSLIQLRAEVAKNIGDRILVPVRH